MFEADVTDAARSRRSDLNGRRRCSAPFFMAVLTLLTLTGCATYYGYDDIHDEITTPMPDGAPRDVRHYAVVTAESGEASLKCFKRYLLPKNSMKEIRIVGRKEWYRDYDANYYFENSPYNAGWNKDAWLWPAAVEKKMFSEWWKVGYLVPVLGQIVLVWDAGVAIVCTCVDGGLFVGRCCWTGVSIPCVWFGGRLFGCWGDWHLAEHKPGPLRMTSYMPFINLFMFQTPPYMTDDIGYGVDIRYDSDEQTVSTRRRIVILTPMQELCARCKVEARVLCRGELCGSREYRTDGDGGVKLTEFLRECVKAAPPTARDFTLELELSDHGGNVLLTRKVGFKAEQLMSLQAARDLAAYRRSDTDQLNRLLLRRRSHREWRREMFADELAIPAAK